MNEKIFTPFQPRNFKIPKRFTYDNLFLHARNTSNIGDIVSTPYNYFTLTGESTVADFWSSVNSGIDNFDNIIIGGGGFGKFVRDPMYFKRLRPKNNLIFWGGFTDAPTLPPIHSDFIDACAIIGTRDFKPSSFDNKKIFFCPCPSAMNRVFDLPRKPPLHKFVFFLHYVKNNPFPDLNQVYPVMDNYRNFTEVINFINSGEVVVTNSYHGLYWSTLLGKKVISLENKGKFSLFKWLPTYASPDECMDILKNSNKLPKYPDSLSEARELNLLFYQKVLGLIGGL
jgi:hypothetical protein